MSNGGFFDQISLAAIANLTAGMTSVNGSFIDLLLSLVVVRVGLRLFYNSDLSRGGEVRLFIVSVIAWILGNSISRGHDWKTQEIYLDPSENMESGPTASESLFSSSAKLAVRIGLDIARKII